MGQLFVRDVLKDRRIVKLRPNAIVSEAAKVLRLERVSAVLIVDDSTLMGILTERDIVWRVVAEGRDIDATKVTDVMTGNPLAVTPDTSERQARIAMRDLGIRHLPVVDRNDDGETTRVVGMLAEEDFDIAEGAS